MEIVARRYDTGDWVRVTVTNGAIASISPLPAADSPSHDCWVSPGFVDLQINGYGGRDFTTPKLTVDDVVAISQGLDRHGVTGYLATVTTNSCDVIAHALDVIDQACRESAIARDRILGVHVEGPYISPEDGPRGAHPREHCRPPDWREFEAWQVAAGGRIKLLTLSPEYDNAPKFIASAVRAGVLIAIGHTNANADQIASAVAAGARMSTHLGNGAHPQIRRHPNYIWDQLADDRLTASIIADGHHLPAAVVKCFTRMKTPARIVLVSDITGMGGMPAGRYSTSLGEVEVLENGKLVVAGQRDLLAGAALPIEHAIANLPRFAGVTLREAIEMASLRPLQLINEPSAGLAVGARANLVVFESPEHADHGPLRIRQTYVRGACTFDG
ncbi:MAG TPA: amidohydrolase family protein [Pirellulaceae bacterium]|nr:amidohydrolase family protein [Pirellulaceae bacterium]